MPWMPVYNKGFDITKSDTVDLPLYLASGRLTDAVYIGAGNAVLVFPDNSTLLVTVPAGASTLFPFAVRRINSTNTTSTVLQAYYFV